MSLQKASIFLVIFLISEGIFLSNVFAELKIPDWIKRVESFWYGQEISNREYVSFINYIIKNQIVSDNYYEKLSKKHTYGIITYNNTVGVSDDILFIAFNEWEKLNPDLVFIESSYSPSLTIIEHEHLPFGVILNSNQKLLGYSEDEIFYEEYSGGREGSRIIYIPAKQDNVTTINEIIQGIGLSLGKGQKGEEYMVPEIYR